MKTLPFLLATATLATVADAQQAPEPRHAAFLYGYRIKPEMTAQFTEGYRRHLDWHRAKGDSLSWLAWSVVDGPNLDAFVDGTFGVTFRAMDARPEPADDGADAARNFAPYADPILRDTYRLLPDLSSATRLESGTPGAMQRVLRLEVRPGAEAAFRQAVRATVASSRGAFAIYERVSGGVTPSYLVIVQLTGLTELGSRTSDPIGTLVSRAGATIVRAETELWAYRPELTYFPSK